MLGEFFSGPCSNLDLESGKEDAVLIFSISVHEKEHVKCSDTHTTLHGVRESFFPPRSDAQGRILEELCRMIGILPSKMDYC